MIDRNESAPTSTTDRSASAGTLALGTGLILILARTIEATFGIPGLPRSWSQNDWLWWLVGLIGIGVGSRLLLRSEFHDMGRTWRPTLPGKRFRNLTLYTRDGCHLCEEAAELLQRHSRWLPAATLTNIDTDPDLIAKFGTCVPVMAVDDKIRFRGRVDATLLRRLIEGTPPIS